MGDDNSGSTGNAGATDNNTGNSGANTGTDGGTGNAGADKTFTQADLDRVVADRVARERAKYADYGDLKKKAAAAMTDQEKAVSDAETRGRTTAQAEAGVRLAKAELRAAAAGRVDQEALAAFLEYADAAKFVGPDGEPDAKAIEAAITKLGGAKAPSFDGGARGGPATGNDMNNIIRRAAGHGG